jgi:hypothetical protein
MPVKWWPIMARPRALSSFVSILKQYVADLPQAEPLLPALLTTEELAEFEALLEQLR